MNKTEVREKLLALLGTKTDFAIHIQDKWYYYPKEAKDYDGNGWTGESVSIQAHIPTGSCPHCSTEQDEFVMTHGHKTWDEAWKDFVKKYDKVKDKQAVTA